MRAATAAVLNYLANWGPSTVASLAELYTFTLLTGEVLRYSGFQIGISAPVPGTSSPSNFFALGPRLDHGSDKTSIGVEIAELEINLYAGPADEIGFPGNGTLTWQEALWAGLFDGCLVSLDHAVIDWTGGVLTVIGTYNEFTGRVGDIDIGGSKTVIRVKSLLDLLTVQVPRRTYQAMCNHAFGGVMCGYDRINGLNALGAATGVGAVTLPALGGTVANAIAFGGFNPAPSTAYDQGTLVGVTGYNTKFKRTIGQVISGTAYLLQPWIFPVMTGDQFQLQPGCDHTLPTCSGYLDNIGRYGGFPDIPPPETAV